jgi:hypothetical protein
MLSQALDQVRCAARGLDHHHSLGSLSVAYHTEQPGVSDSLDEDSVRGLNSM